MLVCSKVSFSKKGFKYFIGCRDGKKIRPLCLMLPKMSICRRDFDETKDMPLLVRNCELLEKYIEILEKAGKTVNKDLIVNILTIKISLRTKIKSYEGKINANFHRDKAPKENSQCICLSVISIDSAF